MKLLKYNKKTRWHRLGKSSTKTKFEPIYPSRVWGTTFIEGKPRTGKTATGKSVTVKVSKYRKVVIIDPNGEWQSDVTKYNWSSPKPDKILNYVIVQNIAFKVSEFGDADDWISAGFTFDAARILAKLAKAKKFHNNDPTRFREVVLDLPEKEADIPLFNQKYALFGIDVDHRFFPMTKISILTKLDYVQEWFLTDNDKRKSYNFEKLFKNYDHLIINLNSPDLYYQRMMTGKILSIFAKESPFDPKRHPSKFKDFGQVPDMLATYKPMIIIEEAARLFPDYSRANEYEVPSSVKMGRLYTFYYPKFHVALMLIFQSEHQIDAKILSESHHKILFTGASGKGPEFKLVKGLLWNADTNEREAVYIKENGIWDIFRPYLSVCKS